jgi:hypothetical protein
MAHFVKLNEDNIVIDKQVVKNEVITDGDGNEQESLGVEFLRTLFNEPTANWKQTSYNNNFRHKYADLQDEYHPDIDQFRQQKPIDNPSFVYNEEKKCWLPPIDQPQDGPSYDWDEASVSWVLSPIQTKAEYLSLGTNTKAFDPNSDELYFPN